jgi:hypothetical protein
VDNLTRCNYGAVSGSEKAIKSSSGCDEFGGAIIAVVVGCLK